MGFFKKLISSLSNSLDENTKKEIEKKVGSLQNKLGNLASEMTPCEEETVHPEPAKKKPAKPKASAAAKKPSTQKEAGKKQVQTSTVKTKEERNTAVHIDDKRKKEIGTIVSSLEQKGQDSRKENKVKEKPQPQKDAKTDEYVSSDTTATSATTDNDFSERMEKLIAAALQDGVLTDKEKEIIRRRAEKEGEDPDEVEMIIEARLADMNASKQQKTAAEATTAKATPAVEEDFKSDVEISNNIKVLDRSYYGYKNIVLPDSVEEILFNQFFNDDKLERIKLSNHLKFIGKTAFWNTHLRNIIIPESVESIGTSAFASCEFLESVDMSQCTKLEELSDETFRGCIKLKEVQFPQNLKEIGKNVFYGCESLKNVQLPSNLKEIGKDAFYGCKSLENVDMSQCTKLEELGEETFRGRIKLKYVQFPQNLKEIGKDAFCGCESLENVDMSQCTELEELGEEAFQGCKRLKSIQLPPNLKKICRSALSGTALQELAIPDTVEEIEDGIVAGCSKLKSLILPQKLRVLGNLTKNYRSHISSLDMSKCSELEEINNSIGYFDNLKQLVIPNGVKTIETKELCRRDLPLKALYLPKTLEKLEVQHDYFEYVYCYSPKLESLDSLSGFADTIYVLPEYIEVYRQQAEAEEVSANIEAIPDDKLYFYDD